MNTRPARVGLMIPSSNTMMEVDFARDLPPGTALHTARMFMEDTTPAGESRMLDEFALPAARDLGTARPDVVVFGCTSAGVLRGNDYDAELCRRIGDDRHAQPPEGGIGIVCDDDEIHDLRAQPLDDMRHHRLAAERTQRFGQA